MPRRNVRRVGVKPADGFRSLTAIEELGRPYEFTVQADSDDTGLAVADLLGTKAAASVQLPDTSLRHFHGIVAAAGLEGASGRRCAWRPVLKPWLWLLTRRTDTRIFQAKTVREILDEGSQSYAHDVTTGTAEDPPRLQQ